MNPLPSLFVSHGAPTFALEPGILGPQLTAVGRTLPRPTAALVVSPHWITAKARVTTSAQPQTLHDFGGFDQALYEIEYPVAGHPELATHTIELLRTAGWEATVDHQRGLDHGAWVPLLHLYPEADVPVYQVSMPSQLDADSAYALGQALSSLSAQGVLIIGSGSLTHNLYEVGQGVTDESYATEFAAWVREAVVSGDMDRLRNTLTIAPYARRAHPTSEHFWPLLIAAGAANSSLPVSVLEGGMTYGVLSMDSFLFGTTLSGGSN